MNKKILNYIINDVVKNRIYKFLSNRQQIIIDYFIATKKLLKLSDPKTFSEKIQWIKVYGRLERYTKYVDKYEVRDFITKTLGKEYLIPLLGVWNSFEEIDFDRLPNQFVLKATHGCAYVYICRNKETLDIHSLRNTVKKWLHENFYNKTRELQYRDCKPRIICEQYMEDESGELIDYKILCFNGLPQFIEVHTGRLLTHNADYKDLNWRKLPMSCVLGPNSNKELRKPKHLKTMINIARILSKPFPFVRVDLYYVKEKIYFGELTFTPANGLGRFEPPEVESKLGELFDLSKYV
jgi:hypothetical protein